MNSARSELPEHHLKYEIDMFFLLGKSLCGSLSDNGIVGLSHVALKNALLESYLVHARNLKDFLWENPTHDDISASLFCSSDGSRSSTKARDRIAGLKISQLDKRINKQISHLTRARGEKTPEQLIWEVRRISCDFATFLQSYLPLADRMDQDYRNEIIRTLSDFMEEHCKLIKENTQVQTEAITTSAISVSVNLSETLDRDESHESGLL